MGHTNSTANLSLPQFIGTDKPTWLGDVNGAFSTIDSKVGTIDADISAVDAKADNAIADASNAVTTATNANNTAGTASTTATNALNVANNALTVANNADGHTNQLEAKVGLLADLTTTDKTSVVNAINEVNAKTITVSVSAEDVAYNNTVSGLTAINVQDAIDELASGGGGGASLAWALAGSTTGVGDVSIPATATDILVKVSESNIPGAFTLFLNKLMLSNTAETYNIGFYRDASQNAQARVNAETTKVSFLALAVGGQSYSNTAVMDVYVR